MASLGLLIGLPVATILFLLCLGFAFLFALDDDWGPVAGGVGAAIVVVIVAGFCFWPWSWDYHHWSTVQGKVAAVSSRLVAGDNSTDQKFVIRFTDGRVRGVTDTRAALVKPGDTVQLKCKKSYQWASQPGWDCNWDGANP